MKRLKLNIESGIAGAPYLMASANVLWETWPRPIDKLFSSVFRTGIRLGKHLRMHQKKRVANCNPIEICSSSWARTKDPLINSQML